MQTREYAGIWLKVVETKPSLPVKAINTLKIGIDLGKYEKIRRQLNRLKPLERFGPVDCDALVLNYVPCIVQTPDGANGQKILFAIHGGGFVLGDGPYCHFSAMKVAMETGYKTVAPDYRLAPEYPFPAALDDVHAAYTGLVGMGHASSDIILYGVSAGGGLCISLCLKLKDEGKPLPRAIIALSPAVNFTSSGETHITKADVDPIFTKGLEHVRDLYAPDHPYDDPYLSPVLGDLAGLPPVRVYVGENELLLADSLQLGENAFAKGVDIEVHVFKNLFHAFPILSDILPEGKQAMNEIRAFLRQQFADA